MNSNQTLNYTLNIDKSLTAIKVIDFLFFFFFWINKHNSSWFLAYLPAIALKLLLLNVTWIWHASYFLTTLFTFSDTFQVLKSVLMSGWVESGVLDEGDSAGFLKPDMFLNVMHI